jgi:dephospho-CoA kinase
VLTVGLTGGIGAGKSTVAAMLAAQGAVIIDADQIARQVVAGDQPAYRSVVDRFGPGVVAPDGGLDRAALASVVFRDPAALRALNAITHPAIADQIARRLADERATDHVVVLDIPLLTDQTRAAYRMATVIVVDAPPEVAVERLVRHRGLTRSDVAARMAAQPSRQQRLAGADVLVDNSGTRAELEATVTRLWQRLVELSEHAL